MNLCVESLCTSWKWSEHMPDTGQCSLCSWQGRVYGATTVFYCYAIITVGLCLFSPAAFLNLLYKQLCLWFKCKVLKDKNKLLIKNRKNSPISPGTRFCTSSWKPLCSDEVGPLLLNECRPNTKTFIHHRPTHSHKSPPPPTENLEADLHRSTQNEVTIFDETLVSKPSKQCCWHPLASWLKIGETISRHARLPFVYFESLNMSELL